MQASMFVSLLYPTIITISVLKVAIRQIMWRLSTERTLQFPTVKSTKSKVLRLRFYAPFSVSPINGTTDMFAVFDFLYVA